MPDIPTKEFWARVERRIRERGGVRNPAAVAAALWRRLSPKVRALYEEARIAREKEGVKSARYRKAMAALRKFWRES